MVTLQLRALRLDERIKNILLLLFFLTFFFLIAGQLVQDVTGVFLGDEVALKVFLSVSQGLVVDWADVGVT